MGQGRLRPILWGQQGVHRARVTHLHRVVQSRSASPPPKFRFSETTAFGMLTTLIQRYKVEPHPKFAREPFEQLKERYSQATGMLTLT